MDVLEEECFIVVMFFCHYVIMVSPAAAKLEHSFFIL
jgi:hypothetical protein